jgi:hypothetical protein
MLLPLFLGLRRVSVLLLPLKALLFLQLLLLRPVIDVSQSFPVLPLPQRPSEAIGKNGGEEGEMSRLRGGAQQRWDTEMHAFFSQCLEERLVASELDPAANVINIPQQGAFEVAWEHLRRR